MSLSRSLPHNTSTMAPPWPTLPDGAPRPPQRDPPLPPLPPSRPSLDSAPPPRNSDLRKKIPRKPVPQPAAPAAPPAAPALASVPVPAPAFSRPTNDSSLVDASQIPSDLVPTLPASSAVQRPQPPPRPSSHGRSMSHPFPSLFPPRRGSLRKTAAQDDFDSDSDSDAEMLGLGPGSKSKTPAQSQGPPYARPPIGDKEYASGNCMTCGALSRWPKGLKVFKCTLCVTINDLVDLKSAIELQNHAQGGRYGGGPAEIAPPNFKGKYCCTSSRGQSDLKSCLQVPSRSISPDVLFETP